MRLLRVDENGEFSLTDDLITNIPPYAILSHTWGEDHEEVNFKDLTIGPRMTKAGYRKLRFCAEQAARDGLLYFWIDTCCIDKSNNTELQEAINSMFRWYRNATKCYVYLSDVLTNSRDQLDPSLRSWEPAFRNSRWFTRGWTLQELLAPSSVEFFCSKGNRLGDKRSLVQEIHSITKIAIQAIEGMPLGEFSVDERMSWAKIRQTKREEDRAYALLGIFDIHIPLIYGEGAANALSRLQRKIERGLRLSSAVSTLDPLPYTVVSAGVSLPSFESVPNMRYMGTMSIGQHSSINASSTSCSFQESTPSEGSTDFIRSVPFWDDQTSTSLTAATDLSLSISEAPVPSPSPENGIKIILRVEVDSIGKHQEVIEASEYDAFQTVYEGVIRARNRILETKSLEPVLYQGTLMHSSVSASGVEDHTFPFNSTFLRAVLEQFQDKYYTSVAISTRFSKETSCQSRSTAHQELRAELEASKVSGADGQFIPLTRIKELLTADRIQKLFTGYHNFYNIPSQLFEMSFHVSEHAPKLLATIILANIENTIPTLMKFLENGFSDLSMPLDGSVLPQFCRRVDYDLICATQPQTLVADISPDMNNWSIRSFNYRYRLPFIERSLIGTGGFSQVFKVTLHPQYILDSDQSTFAIKQLKRSCKDDFLREVDVLHALSSIKHPHLISLLSAFEHSGRYHLMFPLASGSLRSLLIQNDPLQDRHSIPWILRQLAGLVDALHRFHTLPEEKGSGRLGRHGDLKPENVLWFRKAGEDRGVLKIADFGLSRFHNRLDDRTDKLGTLSYLPPERDIRFQSPSLGSTCDIWAFGGMLSEVVAWALGGPCEIEGFRKERKKYVFLGVHSIRLAAPFYHYERGKFIICPAVDRRLGAMIKRGIQIFGEAGNDSADKISDLIKACLIIDPYQRPTARAVADRLNEISVLLDLIEESGT